MNPSGTELSPSEKILFGSAVVVALALLFVRLLAFLVLPYWGTR